MLNQFNNKEKRGH